MKVSNFMRWFVDQALQVTAKSPKTIVGAEDGRSKKSEQLKTSLQPQSAISTGKKSPFILSYLAVPALQCLEGRRRDQ